MVHLLACDPIFSDRIAAFAATNPTILAAVATRHAVKDEVTLLWEKCKPARIPIRFLEIHSENNTVNSYFGKSGVGVNRHSRMPIVQWLVEWAVRNECGPATGHPTKDNEDDTFYLTDLESGTIQEGVVYPDKLHRASYKCYTRTKEEMVADFLKTFQLQDVDSFIANGPNPEKKPDGTVDESGGKESEHLKTLKGRRDEAIKELSETDKPKKDRGVLNLVHYFLKNSGHGWPRVVMKKDITRPMVEGDVATDDEPIFDSTSEILEWFAQNKLSDEFRAPSVEELSADQQMNQEALATMFDSIGTQKEVVEGEPEEMNDLYSEPETKVAESPKEKDEL
jgi:hypothetical protein